MGGRGSESYAGADAMPRLRRVEQSAGMRTRGRPRPRTAPPGHREAPRIGETAPAALLRQVIRAATVMCFRAGA